jgi:hypothetical protein
MSLGSCTSGGAMATTNRPQPLAAVTKPATPPPAAESAGYQPFISRSGAAEPMKFASQKVIGTSLL